MNSEILKTNSIITLSMKDPQVESYLLGNFSAELVAIPQRSLNLVSHNQNITFRLAPFIPLKILPILKILIRLVKPQDWILIFFPFLILLLKNVSDHRKVSFEGVVFSLFGLFFLMMASRTRNHLADHIEGVDRFDPLLAQNPLALGILKGVTFKKYSMVFLVLSLLMSLPLILLQPALLIFVLPAAFMGFYAQFFRASAFKSKTYGEFLVFCLFGPLLTSGIDMALIGQVRAETIIIGFFLGLVSMLLLNLRIFSNYFFLAEMKSQNTLVRIGFDRAKKYLRGLFVLTVAVFPIYQFIFMGQLWFYNLTIFSAFLLMVYVPQFRKCTSPGGSEPQVLQQKISNAIYILLIIWIFQFFWQLYFY